MRPRCRCATTRRARIRADLRYEGSNRPSDSPRLPLLLRSGHARRAAALIGWAAFALVVFATLSPIGIRPHIAGFGPQIERFGAYFLAAAALRLAYPRQGTAIALGVVVFAIGLELAQLLASSRHGAARDAAAKILGGLAGLGLVAALDAAIARWRGRPDPGDSALR